MLSIVLMELWLGETIDGHIRKRRLAPDSSLCSKANALNDWVQVKGGHLPSPYLWAVNHCTALDSLDEQSIAAGLEEIIKNLTRICDVFNGK